MAKNNIRRKAQLGLDIREGGIAIPIANNMWYIHGRKHEDGGVTMGPNNKNGVEVEGGEIVEMIDSNHPSVGRQFAAGGQSQTMRVFSSVPLLRGVSPAQLVMGGANPNKVFRAQEDFKDRNRINDDGTRYEIGGEKKSNSAIRTEEDKKVPARSRAIYSAVDATADYPAWWQAIGLGIGSNFKTMINPDSMNYTVTDSVADAAWRKRLGLSYNDKFLIPNKDGSVRLPRNVEMEIPTDTTMLKRRIAANEQFANQNNIMGEDWKIVQAMIDKDKEALEALRTTYKTGKPVVINEYSHNSRNLSKNGELIDNAINYKSPLNVMRNYTIQYDPKNKSMNYWDTYDFNEFEWGVPGKPFEIKGNIPLKKAGGIYIKPSKRGTFTAAATKRGMGVQEFASKVLANKENYSSVMIKKANFARNASRWKKKYGGNYEPKRNEKGQIVLNSNNPEDIKWLREQQGKRGIKAVHRGQQEFIEGTLNRTTPIMLGIAAANPITTATSLAGGYLLGKVGEVSGKLYKNLTGKNYIKEGKVIGQTIGSLGGPIGAKLFGKGVTNAWNTYKSNRLNSTQTLIDVPETELIVQPNIRINRPKQLDVTNNQKYLPIDVEDLTWKEPKALLETQAQVTRRDLKNFNRWAKLFGYEPVPLRYAETKSIADRHVQDRIKQHNTFLRGVAKPNKLQRQSIEYELAKEGITNPTDYDVYTYMATHSAPSTGAGRADLRPIQVRKHKVGNFNLSKTSDSPIGALYTQGSGRGAAGYAGIGPESGGHRRTGVVVEVARPTHFRPGASYAEWVKENDFNFGDELSQSWHKNVANRIVEIGKAPETYNLSNDYKKNLANTIKKVIKEEETPNYDIISNALQYIKNTHPKYLKKVTQLEESAFNMLSDIEKKAYNEYLGEVMISPDVHTSFKTHIDKMNNKFNKLFRENIIRSSKKHKRNWLIEHSDYNPEDYTQPDFSVLKSTTRNRGNAQQHYIFRAPIGEKILEGRGFYLPTEEEIINATTDHYPLWTPGYSRNTRKYGGIKKFKYGGSMIYEINGNVKNGLMSLRPKAQFGKKVKLKYEVRNGKFDYIDPTTNGFVDMDQVAPQNLPDSTTIYSPEEIKEINKRKKSKSEVRAAAQRDAKLEVAKNTKNNYWTTPPSKFVPNIKENKFKAKENKTTKPIVNETKPTSKAKENKFNSSNISDSRPQYYAEKRLPIAGNKSIAEKAGLDRSGWSYADGSYTINGLNYNIPSITEPKSSTPRRGSNKASDSTTKAAKTTTNNSRLYEDAPIGKVTPNRPNLYIEGLKNKAIDVTPINAALVKGIDMSNIDSSSTGGQTQTKLIGQYKPTTTEDWIGLGSNLGAHLISYFNTKSFLDKYPMPTKPLIAPAVKLKTRFNINSPLTELGEASQGQLNIIGRNTQSSSTSRAAQQRVINQTQRGRNQLYTQKENVETQLINQDRLNRQSIISRNMAAYNDWLDKTFNNKVRLNNFRASLINDTLTGMAGGIGDMLSRIENRRNTNNTLRVIAAANPNVDARQIGGFDYYTDMYGRRYDKNGKLIKR